MAAFAWSVAVPAGLYLTRSVGSGVQQGLLRQPEPEPLDHTIDTAGALAAAEAALSVVSVFPISPTVQHLRSLVRSGAQKLRDELDASTTRLQTRTFSRLFRRPCFRAENRRLRAGVAALTSRTQLFLGVVSVFPPDYAPSPASAEARRRRALFHSTLTATQELRDSDSEDADDADDADDEAEDAPRD